MTTVLVHEVWEMGEPRDYPVVTHEFRGETREEAYAIYLAHLQSDAFLRGCVENDSFLMADGTVVKCTVRWWYDDDDARTERIARAWIEAREQPVASTVPFPHAATPASMAPPRFQPRLIRGGAETGKRPLGHEHHDPDVCDVRTG